MKRAAAIIRRAVDNGLTEVFVGRFSNRLCTDRGRAIIQMEPGWETTLTGLPKELFAFWEQYLKPRGYKIKFQSSIIQTAYRATSASRSIGPDTHGRQNAKRRPRSHLPLRESRTDMARAAPIRAGCDHLRRSRWPHAIIGERPCSAPRPRDPHPFGGRRPGHPRPSMGQDENARHKAATTTTNSAATENSNQFRLQIGDAARDQMVPT